MKIHCEDCYYKGIEEAQEGVISVIMAFLWYGNHSKQTEDTLIRLVQEAQLWSPEGNI